jgi:hypothetical protein
LTVAEAFAGLPFTCNCTLDHFGFGFGFGAV